MESIKKERTEYGFTKEEEKELGVKYHIPSGLLLEEAGSICPPALKLHKYINVGLTLEEAGDWSELRERDKGKIV